jgi:hypothetical protein
MTPGVVTPRTLKILRHCVPRGADGLSPLQRRCLDDPAPVRIFSAPTGAGKSFAFVKAAAAGARVLFVVPTRRLAQNLCASAIETLVEQKVIATREAAAQLVAMWTSDATAELRKADPNVQIGNLRIRQIRGFEGDCRFIVATPESLAFMLLAGLRGGHGGHAFGLADIVDNVGHVVFDEFHTIDPRGFGLCAAIATVCAHVEGGAKVTFLSATPIDIRPVLTQLGVPAGEIAVGAETITTERKQASSNLRALHGDVQLTFSQHDDLVELLEAHRETLRACIDRGPDADHQIVVIFDSLDALLSNKRRLAVFFDGLGVPASRRLAINSVDDRTTGDFDGLFVADRTADPKGFDVLVATSSVEMGVTFKAGLIAMDPGHDALSFVQRLGRVARGDVEGTVLVRLDARGLDRHDWLRKMLLELDEAPGASAFDIEQFLGIVLKAARRRFSASVAELATEIVPTSFRSMPQRAVWAAALFWRALEDPDLAQGWMPQKGRQETLKAFRPPKAGLVAKLLGDVAAPLGPRETGGQKWARAFLAEAATLRDVAATMPVIDPDGRTHDAVPLRLIESRNRLAAAPVGLMDDKLVLFIDAPLHQILSESERSYREQIIRVALPNGTSRQVPLKSAADETLRVLKALEDREPSIAKRARYAAARKLVRLSGIVPKADAEVVPTMGSVVLG